MNKKILLGKALLVFGGLVLIDLLTKIDTNSYIYFIGVNEKG